MKIRILVILLMLIMLCALSYSQVYVRTEQISTAGKYFINGTKDSTVGISLYVNANTINETMRKLVGVYPDSIAIVTYSSGDSAYALDLRFKAAQTNISNYTSVLVDSVKSATATPSLVRTKIAGVNYLGYDNIGLSIIARSAGNAVVLSNANRIYCRIEFYYKLYK